MKFFTSKRERKLWIWTSIVVGAIYLTLPFAPILAEHLREVPASGTIFFLGFILILLSIFFQGIKLKPSGLELGILIGIIGAYILIFLRIAIIEERSHIIEYSVVAFLIYEALLERKRNGGKVPIPIVLAILFSSIIGVIDECIQLFIPIRVFDPTDILFNFLASVMAVLGVSILRWARKKALEMNKPNA